jgi:hypothetical protein
MSFGPFLNSFLEDGPSVPTTILRRVGCRNGCLGTACCFALELVKQAIEFHAVKDDACALVDSNQVWSPSEVERSTLDTDVLHGFDIGQAAFHVTISLSRESGNSTLL